MGGGGGNLAKASAKHDSKAVWLVCMTSGTSRRLVLTKIWVQAEIWKSAVWNWEGGNKAVFEYMLGMYIMDGLYKRWIVMELWNT